MLNFFPHSPFRRQKVLNFLGPDIFPSISPRKMAALPLIPDAQHGILPSGAREALRRLF